MHLTQAQADAVFLGDRLAPVAAAHRNRPEGAGLMRQNLFFAIGYNVMAVPFAMSGHASPLFAALAMSGSSILVTLNALRLRGPGKSRHSAFAGAEGDGRRTRAQGGAPKSCRGAFGLTPGLQWNDAMNVLIFLIPLAMAIGLLGALRPVLVAQERTI